MKEFSLRKLGLKLTALAIGATLLGGCAPKNSVENYPEKEIRVIVAFGPGGQTDLISRKLGEIIQKNQLCGSDFLTVNMPGGNTADAVNAVLGAKPDGYTFLLHHSNLITNHIMGNLDKTYTDFDMVGGIVTQSFGIVARADDDRWKDGNDLIRDIKAEPGKYSVTFPGYAGPGHFALLQFLAANDALGTMKEVPSEGGADAITAHLGGHVDLRMTNMGDAARFIKSGEIKWLAMATQERNPSYPDVICLKDMGSDSEAMTLRTGFFAPKGTPVEVREKFMDIIRQAAETQEFKDFIADMNQEIELTDGEQFKQNYDNDYKTLSELAKDLKK